MALFGIGLASVSVGVTAGSVAAHYVYQSSCHYSTSSLSVSTYSEMSHGGGGGYNKVTMFYYGGSSCSSGQNSPSNSKRAGFYNLKQVGSGSTICTQTSPFWVVDPSADHSHSINASSNTPPCGNGNYGTAGYGSAKKNGVWTPHSGLFSGWHSQPS